MDGRFKPQSLGNRVIKHFFNPPNWFTAASIFCSVYAMASIIGADALTPEVMSRACVLVIFGGVFDLLDGRVARITKRFTEFGVQLDSLADIIGFGVAPALIAYTWTLHELGPVGIGVAFWYVLCASFRLARFNVNSSEPTWELKGHSQGLTSTMAGGSVVTFVWVCNGYLAELLHPPAWFVALVVAALGGLMISSLPFRNFKDLRRSKVTRRYLAVGVASGLMAAVVFDISMWWAVGAVFYLVVGVFDGLVVAYWHRQLSKALMMDELEAFFEDDGFEESDEELEPS